MKYHFCTYFDANYLFSGLALHASLKEHCKDFILYVCCLNRQAYDILSELAFPGIVPLQLEEIERFDPEFAATRKTRSIVEYYFTLSPVLPRFLFARYPELDLLTYLDADLYFYSSPEPVFAEFGENSLSLIEHRFPPELQFREKFGKYNLQFQIYRRDKNTDTCLAWWRERCIEWCYDRLEEERFADQKYLEQWTEKFGGVTVLQHPGAGLAPWNWFQYELRIATDGKLTVDGTPLIFYHFQGFRVLGQHYISTNLGSYGHVMSRHLRNFFYGNYYLALRQAESLLKTIPGGHNIKLGMCSQRTGFSSWRAYLSAIRHRNLMRVN